MLCFWKPFVWSKIYLKKFKIAVLGPRATVGSRYNEFGVRANLTFVIRKFVIIVEKSGITWEILVYCSILYYICNLSNVKVSCHTEFLKKIRYNKKFVATCNVSHFVCAVYALFFIY